MAINRPPGAALDSNMQCDGERRIARKKHPALRRKQDAVPLTQDHDRLSLSAAPRGSTLVH